MTEMVRLGSYRDRRSLVLIKVLFFSRYDSINRKQVGHVLGETHFSNFILTSKNISLIIEKHCWHQLAKISRNL